MLIAVATKDGKEINQHFGHAERFLIYEVEGEQVRLVDERRVERYCRFDPEHPLRSQSLKETAEALQGCRAVVCAMIGAAPQLELEKFGMATFVVEGKIPAILPELARVL